ncbi:MAG: lytic murein transglycosylase B [Chromatiaceae bacterium]
MRLLVCSILAFLSLAACSSGPRKTSASTAGGLVNAADATFESRGGRASISSSRDTAIALETDSADGGAVPVTGDYAGNPRVQAFIRRMEREHGFDPVYLNGVFSRVDRQQWILDFVNRPRSHGPIGPTGAWTRYRAKFLTAANISNGADFWRRYEAALDRAYARYGVPPEYVVAILGVETRYGGYVGKYRVVEALTTLAFGYPRRSEFFTGELEAFLVMARDEGFDPFQPVGSYAGAMGLGQFMPSSFHRFAVDFDGDGKRDLWDPVDAIGSVANYFAAYGWQSGELVAVPADVSGSAPHAMKADFSTSYSMDALRVQGITSSLTSGRDVSLLRLDARGGYEYWLGLKNFYVITRYNHSTYYAMAVHQLAQAIRARHGSSQRPTLTQRSDDNAPPFL